ncbi:MAG: helix-turn-helix transcriptional regulator [Novosphingobium sp.]|nr:helix-turn-helix transcriptional regulator [Novosphingobium sp.]
MELVGERWTLPIVREMMLGPRRFNGLRAALPGLSAKVLTERLGSLEASGIVRRLILPPPASVQAYALTEWGLGLEPVMQELGRWAVRSPGHDPMLPLTPVAFMLSLRTMLVPERIGDLALRVLFEVGTARFIGTLGQGELRVEPAGADMAVSDLRFAAETATDFLPVFYGKRSVEEAGGRLSVEGDEVLAKRFIGLFALPAKLG